MTSNVGLKGLRGILEAALESYDISPLIKLVSSSSTARQTTEAEDTASPSASPAGGKRDEGLALAEGTLNGVVHTLQGISERRDLELKRTCQANSSEITSALKELTAVQATSADLRRRAQETSASMQRMGAHFSSRMDALNEALLVRDRIQQTRSALQSAMYIISLCQEAAESIETGQLYHARKVLLTLKTRYGPALKASAAGVGDGEQNFQLYHEGLPATQVGSLGGKLLFRMNELDSKVDARLTSYLNEWLTQARAVAGTVGRRAMELVDVEKEKNLTLAQQRRQMMIFQKEEESRTVSDVAGIAADLKSKLDLLGKVNIDTSTITGVAGQLNKDGFSTNENDNNRNTDPASLVDMILFLRCVHVHSSENTLSQLLESYVEARQAQLGADLAPPGDLLICYRAFLWQIVGFFVIETRVGVVAPHLETSAHAEASWEGASAALAAELGAAIDEASRPEDIRELKKQALLACEAIDTYCGDALSTRGIRSTLTSRVERIRTTMASGVSAALEEVSASSTTVPEGMETTIQGNTMSTNNSTAASLTNRMEAFVTNLSKECSDYMSGLVEEHALPAATCIEVDHILAAAISAKVAAFVIKDGQGDDDGHGGGYLSTDSDDPDSSYDPQDDNEDNEEEEDEYSDEDDEYSSSERSGSSLYSDGNDSRTSSGTDSSDSSSQNLDNESGNDDDERGSDAGHNGEDEEEGRFVELLQLVSVAAAAESALNSLREKLLGSSYGGSTTASGTAIASRTTTSPTTQLSGSLMATEDAAGRRIAYSAYTAVDALADLDWAPQSMPRAAGGNVSFQCAEILEVLEAGRTALESCGAPPTSQQRILGAAVRRIEEEIMRVLVSDAVPYINVFGAQRLLSDLQALLKCAGGSSSSSNSLSEWVSEPVLFGELVAFNKAAELLDSEKRGGKYASVNLDRFIVLLEKVKDPAGPPSAVGRGFLKAEDARKVAAELKNIISAERGR